MADTNKLLGDLGKYVMLSKLEAGETDPTLMFPQTVADLVVVNDRGSTLYEYLPTMVNDENHPSTLALPFFAVYKEQVELSDDLANLLCNASLA